VAIRGVILAGGRGRRLGANVPKPWVELGGVALVRRAVSTLGGVCDAIVVTAPKADRAAWAWLSPAASFVADPEGAEGPLAGLVAGLEGESYDEALVLAVDFPLVTAALLDRLLSRLRSSGDAKALVPMPAGIPQPLVAAYRPTARAPLAASLAAGERSVVRAVTALDPVWVADRELGDDDRDALFNVNTAADLAEAERRMRGSRAG
jgi:molybdopterin-guanine dinucleotide biosynthesis protein A